MASQPRALHIAAAIVTTRERRDHHHYHPPTSYTSARPPRAHPIITTRATQAADAFAKALPSSTSLRPLAYARSEGECRKNRGRALGPRTSLRYSFIV